MATLDLRSPPPGANPTTSPTDTPSPAPPSPLAWEAPEYHVRPKSLAWYAGFGAAFALLLFTAFLMRSFLTGVVFGLLGLLILLYSERSPKTVRFSLSPESLTVNDRRYPLRELDAFNVVDSLTGTGFILLIRSRRLFMPLIHVPLGTQDSEAVRGLLRGSLREDLELRESLTDLLAHRLGF